MSNVTAFATSASEVNASRAIFGIALAQFLLGTLIIAINVLALGATLSNRKIRNRSFYLLAGNLWFANLIQGIIVMVGNVVDHAQEIALAKAEGTAAVMNSLATLATLLAISTARTVSIKAPHHRMAMRSAMKIIVGIWAAIFALVLIKAVVFALWKLGYNACYECLLGFEAALLVIFGAAAVLMYIAAVYMVCVHRGSTVQDSNNRPAAAVTSFVRDYRDTFTTGLWLGVFTLPFLCLVVLLGMYTINKALDFTATEAILTFFYLHCVVNPVIFMMRDDDVKQTCGRILKCQRPNADDQREDEAQDAGADQQLNGNGVRVDRNMNHLPPIPAGFAPRNQTQNENHNQNHYSAEPVHNGYNRLSTPTQPTAPPHNGAFSRPGSADKTTNQNAVIKPPSPNPTNQSAAPNSNEITNYDMNLSSVQNIPQKRAPSAPPEMHFESISPQKATKRDEGTLSPPGSIDV